MKWIKVIILLFSLSEMRSGTYSIRWKYLGASTLIALSGSLLGVGILYSMPQSITRWDKSQEKYLLHRYQEHLKKAPAIDSDLWWINWMGHPYWGAVYFLQGRIAGFGVMFSIFYSFLYSTFFWEYGIEAFAEVPSLQDLVITPLLGSLLGMIFYRLILRIKNNEGKIFDSKSLGWIVLFFLDPIGSILKGLSKIFPSFFPNLISRNQKDH